MIVINDLSLVLPEFSLKEINLHIKHGDFFAIIGPTGSGKSLLLEAAMGFMPPTSGKIAINGQDVSSLAPEKRGLGLVYQDHALFPHLNVRQNILFGQRYHSLPTKELMALFDRLVQTMGLERILKRYPGTLSGGEKQRVALARALILKPAAVMLDEPLSALDPVFQEDIRGLLKTLHQELEATLVMVSHNFSEVLYLANRGAIINKGKIKQTGLIEDLFERPNSPFAANFVGMKNIFDLEIDQGQGYIEKRSLCVHLNEYSRPEHNFLALRPEEIAPLRSDENSYENIYEGVVTGLICQGFYFDVSLQVDKVAFKAVWTRNQVRSLKLLPGDNIRFGFNTTCVHTFAA